MYFNTPQRKQVPQIFQTQGRPQNTFIGGKFSKFFSVLRFLDERAVQAENFLIFVFKNIKNTKKMKYGNHLNTQKIKQKLFCEKNDFSQGRGICSTPPPRGRLCFNNIPFICKTHIPIFSTPIYCITSFKKPYLQTRTQ
eukprot:TRINITY_DN13119_c0_g2_i5.p4 TRINITY_DN13119_c0_g2~~TRINITY_DN13119_c0_g2_i5.p4  ORF type:complete len:139 (-),score=2.51 TRINITY_DN13119_c0_g2_i5:199-615(-)